jgi:LytS/YehU family sensor histidine kinase
VAAYLHVEEARFGERLQVKVSVDAAATAIQVPAMSLQPLVENAIKHGTSTVEGQGRVGLSVTLNHETLSIEVRDNGPGFSLAAPGTGHVTGHGLRNIAERLSGYYGDSARLSWENDSAGTRVWLKIPCRSGAARISK